jgi:alkylation response protein AidB-like acyl-CoA dehydrogenase
VPTGMDFTLGETQEAVARVVAEVLDQGRAPAHPGAHDPALWKELGRAGVLSLALPAWLGGEGLGVMDVAVALTEIGRRAASVPALATLALGVLPVVRWGDRDLQQAVLDGVASGGTVLTAAVREPSEVMPVAPATTATLAGSSGTISGVKVGVPYGAEADWILVPASMAPGGGTGIVVVAKSAGGVSWLRAHSAAGDPEYALRLDDAPFSRVLGAVKGDGEGGLAKGEWRRGNGEVGGGSELGGGDRAVADLYQLAIAGACCLADGAVAGALSLTTSHVASREQFGRPLATFQAVAEKIADVYITSRTLHLAALSACWRLETGREAGPDLDVAAYWLAEQAPAALRTCHHLHGGIGMDATYPLHRYSSLVKDLVRFVGGADHRLDRLGARACDRATASAGVVPPGQRAGGSGGVVPPGQH